MRKSGTCEQLSKRLEPSFPKVRIEIESTPIGRASNDLPPAVTTGGRGGIEAGVGGLSVVRLSAGDPRVTIVPHRAEADGVPPTPEAGYWPPSRGCWRLPPYPPSRWVWFC